MRLFFIAALATLFLATGALAGPVAVKVKADNGGPIAGLPVKIEAVAFGTVNTKVSTPFKGSSTTGGDGVASFTVPDNQMYEVSVEYMGQVFKRHVRPGPGQPMPIDVPASKVVNQPFFIHTTHNHAVSGARIVISQSNKPVKTVTADGDGAVHVPLLAGTYSIQVSGNGKNVTQNISVRKPPQLVQVNIDGQGRSGPVKALRR